MISTGNDLADRVHHLMTAAKAAGATPAQVQEIARREYQSASRADVKAAQAALAETLSRRG